MYPPLTVIFSPQKPDEPNHIFMGDRAELRNKMLNLMPGGGTAQLCPVLYYKDAVSAVSLRQIWQAQDL